MSSISRGSSSSRSASRPKRGRASFSPSSCTSRVLSKGPARLTCHVLDPTNPDPRP